MRGGYTILDCKGLDLATSKIVANLYETIEGNYNKPFLVSNFSLDGIEQKDTFVTCQVNGTDYILLSSGFKFVVNDDNEIYCVGNIEHIYRVYITISDSSVVSLVLKGKNGNTKIFNSSDTKDTIMDKIFKYTEIGIVNGLVGSAPIISYMGVNEGKMIFNYVSNDTFYTYNGITKDTVTAVSISEEVINF